MEFKRKVTTKVTPKQKDRLVCFMEENKDFARAKFVGLEGKLKNNSLWELLAQELNSSEPTKTVIQWQRVWVDIKMAVKRKVSAQAASRRKTGGGSPVTVQINISDFEHKVIQIISPDAVFGIGEPDCLLLDSAEEYVAEPSTIAPVSSNVEQPAKKRAKLNWLSMVETEEQNYSTRENFHNQTLSSHEASPQSSPSGSIRNKSITAQTADELKELHRYTIKAVEDVGEKITYSLNTLNTTIQRQMEESREDRRQTNEILLRIAEALEDRK